MNATDRNTLNKNERIHGIKRIEKLFTSGSSFISYPLRIVFRERVIDREEAAPISMMVSVSKKKFKRAVKRNRTKRLIKEAFRLNKSFFNNISDKYEKGIDIAFLYLKDELPDFKEIENAILKSAVILEKKIKERSAE